MSVDFLPLFFVTVILTERWLHWKKQYKLKQQEVEKLTKDLHITTTNLNAYKKAIEKMGKDYDNYVRSSKNKERNLNKIIKVLRAGLQ